MTAAALLAAGRAGTPRRMREAAAVALVCLLLAAADAVGQFRQDPETGEPISPVLPQDRASDDDDGGGGGTSAQEGDESSDPFNPLRPAPLEKSISTGRPSFSTGTGVVPAGRFQAEGGLVYTSDDGGADFTSLTFPSLLLRYGLYPDVELRLSGASYVANDSEAGGAAGEDGFTDLTLGVKLVARDQRGVVPAVAFLPSVSFPTGGVGVRDQIDPAIQVATGWTVGRTSFLINTNLNSVSVARETTAQFSHSLAVIYDLPDVLPDRLDRLQVFVEHFASYPDGLDDRQSLDAGVLLLLGQNLQLDLFVGGGLNDAATDFFTGVGLAVRL